MSTADDIADHFVLRNWQWTFDGESRIPTSEEVAGNLDKSIAVLYNEPEGTSLQVGGMIIHKSAGHYDIYAHFGEWKENDSN